MSAVRFTLITISILSRTALSEQGSGVVTWKPIGTSITITCSSSIDDPVSLCLKKVLHEEVEMINLYKTGKLTIKQELQTRVTTNDQMKTFEVTIGNLTRADSGLYRCFYTTLDENLTPKQTVGTGTVLLAVEDSTDIPCATSTVLLVVCALTGGFVLLIGVVVLSIWGIPKIKSYCSSFAPAPVHDNEGGVYEDMQSTLRRRDDRPVRGQQQPLAQHPC